MIRVALAQSYYVSNRVRVRTCYGVIILLCVNRIPKYTKKPYTYLYHTNIFWFSFKFKITSRVGVFYFAVFVEYSRFYDVASKYRLFNKYYHCNILVGVLTTSSLDRLNFSPE